MKKMYIKEKNIAEFKKRLKELLQPVGEYLKAEGEASDNLRKKRGSAGQSESAAILCEKIKERFEDFRLPPTQPKPLPKDKGQTTEEEVKKQVEDTEVYLCKFVYEKLAELYGDQWYDKGVPGDLNDQHSAKGMIETLLKEELSKNPFRRDEYQRDPGLRLEFTHLGNLIEIIVARQNWSKFEEAFGSQRRVQKQVSDLIDLRNALQHFRTIDQTVWGHGRAALMWVRKCLKIWIEESQ